MLINTGSARRKVPAQRQRGRTILSHADPRAGRLTHLLGSKQQGTALIFALVMLLLLTILGITAVTTSSLQEKMAGNMRDQYMAQQAGDSILFDGQALIFNQKTKPLPSCPPDPVALIWDSSCLPTSTGAASRELVANCHRRLVDHQWHRLRCGQYAHGPGTAFRGGEHTKSSD